METQIATTSATLVELSNLNQWAILSGYISWAIALVVIGFFFHAVVSRKRK